jgi:hypothetical protein
MASAEHLRVIVFPEDGLYVAQCLEHDIVAQAPDIEDALERLELTIEAERAMRGTNDLSQISPAPGYYQELWGKHSLRIQRVNVPMQFEVELARAA